ncbi:bifunctional ADP-dependent NAD(P)H-hydrate dehydratase/NAD(P)H-hydrate epimerase, partial [uncultured Corynebacterium sp.]|uniref:bifunctional ADP-dependent NAD(P)H-hydrate dehydratase/NAD(P)H-hydrate epimerase n=1 Tax=uncultured Corynebacterium sp. TaxID=159447 RepID=UPI0025D80A1E
TAPDTVTVYTVDQIRCAEQPLLDAQTRPDELMQSAASAVAEAAHMMLRSPSTTGIGTRVLLAVGPGGNGGDALYAGRDLLDDGWEVDAVLLGRDRTTGDVRVHRGALDAFTGAGGTVVDYDDLWTQRPSPYRLLIDGVLGMGGAGGVDALTATVLDLANRWLFPLLSIDVPSGIDADTGAVSDPVNATDPLMNVELPFLSHAVADVTVTFGGWRRVHAVSALCGQVLLADPALDSGESIGAGLGKTDAWWRRGPGLHVGFARAVTPDVDPRAEHGLLDLGGVWDAAGTGLASPDLRASRLNGPVEPGPDDDKYTGGVVGVCAGSARFPGAAVLATTGAVRATSAMVRYIGTGAPEVLRATPEVIWSPTVAETGRVQAWVVGPGRGTDDAAAAELAELLDRPEPLLIDADALTLLAERPELREALIARSPDARGAARDDRQTLLTPHAGEFRRLADAVSAGAGVDIPDPDTDRIGAAVALSEALHCAVLLKGRHTVIVQRPDLGRDGAVCGARVTCIDAGTSWGATPGSGDVLAGVTGALMAETTAKYGVRAAGAAPRAVALHAIAAAVAAETPDGYAPTSASRIADAVPRAWARSGPSTTRRRRPGC